MARLAADLFALGLFLSSLLALAHAIGFPTGGGGGGGCCCPCGGGGGGCMSSCGCGRKKREAVMPHFKGDDVPCPQVEWRELMDEAIVAGDAISSLTAIQSALHGRFGENKFLVNCADGGQPSSAAPTTTEATSEVATTPQQNGPMPTNVHFSAGGDGYCNVQRGDVWCQAVALHA